MRRLKRKLRDLKFIVTTYEAAHAFFREGSLRLQANALAFWLVRSRRLSSLGLNLQIDLKSWPPTLGDFFSVAMLARVMQRKIDTVYLAISGRSTLGQSWIESGNHTPERILAVWRELSEDLCTNLIFSEVGESSKPSIESIGEKLLNKNLLELAPRVLKAFWNQSSSQDTRNLFRIDSLRFEDTELKQFGLVGGGYTAVHIRASSFDSIRNSSFNQNSKVVIQAARDYPTLPIVILSDQPLGALFTKTFVESEVFRRVRRQPLDGYLNAMRILLSSKHFYQVFGGGMGMPAIFSTVPYSIVVEFSGSWPNPHKGRLAPWATDSQQFLVRKQSS